MTDRAFGKAELIMGMSPDVWDRHVNPWSGWTRITLLPLLCLARWSVEWIGWWALGLVALVIIWGWLNPRVFPKPERTDNWMSQGVIGERIWLERSSDPALAHHVAVVKWLTRLSGAGAIVMIVGLALLNLPLAVGGMVTAMIGKLWLLDRMVWVSRDTARLSAEPDGGR